MDAKGKIKLTYCPTEDMVAGALTKARSSSTSPRRLGCERIGGKRGKASDTELKKKRRV
jgi:hypothetical protein